MSAGSLAWFAHHELRLSWRDFARMMHATRSVRSVVAVAAFVVLMHVIAYAVVGRFADIGDMAEKADLVIITAGAFLTWLYALPSPSAEVCTCRKSREAPSVAVNS